VLINKTAVTKLGWTPDQALGKWIQNKVRDDAKRRVIGVVDDFNFQSLKKNIDALVIAPNEDRRVAVVKLKPGNIQTNINMVKREYTKVRISLSFRI
jgi:putative ABC transport system permease protein